MNQKQIDELIARLERISKQARADIDRAPEGTLSLSSVRGRYQFRWRRPGYPLAYLNKSKRDLAAKLAQKDYALKMQAEVNAQLKAISKMSKALSAFSLFGYDDNTATLGLDASGRFASAVDISANALHRLESIYDSLPQPKQELVIPYIKPLRDFIFDWEADKIQHSSIFGQGNRFQTAKGELVRSKSEVIIADKMYYAGVPYKYEQPFETAGGTLYPDFIVLDVWSRKEIVWEHFGLMDDIEYCNRCITKLGRYAREGLFPGNGLITTFETSQSPLDILQVDKIIQLIHAGDVHSSSI